MNTLLEAAHIHVFGEAAKYPPQKIPNKLSKKDNKYELFIVSYSGTPANKVGDKIRKEVIEYKAKFKSLEFVYGEQHYKPGVLVVGTLDNVKAFLKATYSQDTLGTLYKDLFPEYTGSVERRV